VRKTYSKVLSTASKYEKVTSNSRSATPKYESMKEVTRCECRDYSFLGYIYINKYGTHHFICVVEKIYYLLIIYKTYIHHTQFLKKSVNYNINIF